MISRFVVGGDVVKNDEDIWERRTDVSLSQNRKTMSISLGEKVPWAVLVAQNSGPEKWMCNYHLHQFHLSFNLVSYIVEIHQKVDSVDL